MYEINGYVLFSLITIGLTIGAVVGQVIKEEGINFYANVVVGVTGCVGLGILAIMMGFQDGLLIASVETLALLFLVNVFHYHHVEDIEGDIDHIFIRKDKVIKS